MARKQNKSGKGIDNSIFAAIDLMLAGHHTVIGSDFIATRQDNSDIGHLNPSALDTYDQDFINTLVSVKSEKKIRKPANLESLFQEYKKQRVLIGDYHSNLFKLAMTFDMQAAKELGNFDEGKVIIRNDPEMNVFFDYIALYRRINGKRSVIYWNSENEHLVTMENKAVVTAYENAKLSVLRLDKNLDQVAIKVTDIITGDESILMDRALNQSRKEGHFFICSTMKMNKYIMSSGGGIHLDATYPGGKSALSLIKKNLDMLRSSKECISDDIAECVREIYGFCLRGGALVHMTIGQ